MEVPGSIPGIVFGNFQFSYSFWPHSVALDYSQPLTEVSIKEYPWVLRAASAWSWQLCRHICAECEIMDGSPTFHHFLCLHDSLRWSFTFSTAVTICTLTLFTTMQWLLAPAWLLDLEGEGIRSFHNIGSSLSDTALRTEDLSVSKYVSQERALPYLLRFKVQLWFFDIFLVLGCSSMFPRRLCCSRLDRRDMAAQTNMLWHMNQIHLVQLADTVRQHCTWWRTWR